MKSFTLKRYFFFKKRTKKDTLALRLPGDVSEECEPREDTKALEY